MGDFETQLRTRLREAAEKAPAFRGLDTASPERGQQTRLGGSSTSAGLARRRRRARVATVVVAAAGVGSVLWLTTRGGDTVDEALCPATIAFEGRTYLGHGGGLRTARPGPVLGSGVRPACHGEGPISVRVRSLPGVDPGQAVLTSEGVWVVEGAATLPEPVVALDRAVPCRHEGTTTVAGDWVAYEGPQPERDYWLIPPYTAEIQADAGSTLPLDRWSMVTIEVRVTPDTVGGTERKLARDALGGTTRVAAVVRCDGDSFVAESLTRDLDPRATLGTKDDQPTRLSG
jgi:hypothetical protein